MSGLRVGVAAADITPDRPLALEGYGARSGVANGTLDALAAQALVFDDGTRRAALVTADVCGIEAASVQRIRAAVNARCGIGADELMVTFSHTHGAPAVTPFASVAVDAAYLSWLEDTLARLVQDAAESLRPATLGAGQGSMDFNVNRRLRTPAGTIMRANPAGLVDRRVRVLRLDRDDRQSSDGGTLGGSPLPASDPIALLFSYPCHPTVKSAENTRYTADYPGSARRFIEHTYAAGPFAAESGVASQPPATRPAAIFLPPCFGTLRPHLIRPDGAFRSGTDHELTVLGRLLGSAVIQVAERIVAEPVPSIAAARRQVWLPYATVPPEEELRRLASGPLAAWADAMLERLARDGSLPAGEYAEVQVLRLGRHWLVATPGETTPEIGFAIERGLTELGVAHPDRGDLVLPVGYANAYVGYLCSASVQLEGGYEPNDYTGYLRPGPFSPQIEPILVNAALSIAQSLAP